MHGRDTHSAKLLRERTIPLRIHPLSLLSVLLLTACELERVEPASVGSASAQGAVVAEQLVGLVAEIEGLANAIQAASDPEAVQGTSQPPDVVLLRSELDKLHGRRDELVGVLQELERLAAGATE